MKENKNLVFGLNSFLKQPDHTFKPDGFLLFPDENKAMEFLELCENINAKGKTCHYEKFTWVKVGDYIGERVNVQKHFYVAVAEAYELNDEEKALVAKNAATLPEKEDKPVVQEPDIEETEAEEV